MEKEEIRVVIKYFFLKGLKPLEIKSELDSTFPGSSPTLQTIRNWTNEFKRGRRSTKSIPPPGRPKTATSAENIEKVRQIVSKDRRMKLLEIAEASGISEERVHFILHKELNMRKLCARWVPRLLTSDNKLKRVSTSKSCLEKMERHDDFFRRLITVDETWVHHYTPETKRQSMQWIAVGEPAPKKAKTVASSGKVLATVFWDARGIILIDYLQQGRTITGEYYANLLDQLKDCVLEKRPHLSKKKIFFLQDNAPPHTSKVAMSKIAEIGFELIAHPPYSPDLAPSDFYLFPKLKEYLAGKKYGSNDEVISAVDGYFEDLDKSAYNSGIRDLKNRLLKCIEVQGEYVEK